MLIMSFHLFDNVLPCLLFASNLRSRCLWIFFYVDEKSDRHDDRARPARPRPFRSFSRSHIGGGGGFSFGSDKDVPLKSRNPYPSLRVILVEKGTDY